MTAFYGDGRAYPLDLLVFLNVIVSVLIRIIMSSSGRTTSPALLPENYMLFYDRAVSALW